MKGCRPILFNRIVWHGWRGDFSAHSKKIILPARRCRPKNQLTTQRLPKKLFDSLNGHAAAA